MGRYFHIHFIASGITSNVGRKHQRAISKFMVDCQHASHRAVQCSNGYARSSSRKRHIEQREVRNKVAVEPELFTLRFRTLMLQAERCRTGEYWVSPSQK